MTEPARPQAPARPAPDASPRAAESQGVESRGVESRGVESRGVESQGVESQGVEPHQVELGARPVRADGLTWLGEFAGSGLARPVVLARRADGQVVSLTELLARILEAADGGRDVAEIAEHVGRRCAREVSAHDVAYLVTHRLRPLGLIAAAYGATPAPRASSLFLLAGRRTLLPASAVYRISGIFGVFFRPTAMAGLLSLLMAADVWLFGMHSARDSAAAVLAAPWMILLLVGLTLVCALFHECGHAAACRYGGARPGVIGVGMYLVWPAFFTDVTDSYRLRRGGRLRTDLGGVYFNGIFALLLIGTFACTRAEVLVTAAVLVHLDAMRQLAPFVRLDGYYVISDLVGVPDLFDRIGPALRSAAHATARALRRRPAPGPESAPDPRLAGLTRRARVMVTAWALCTAPMIAVNLVMLVVYAPFVLPRTASAMNAEFGRASQALTRGELVTALAGAVSTVLVALPAAGMLFMLIRLGRRGARVAGAVLGRRRRSRQRQQLTSAAPSRAVPNLLPCGADPAPSGSDAVM